jgi:hypothetical protein
MADTLRERHYRDRLESLDRLTRRTAGDQVLPRNEDELVAICCELAVAGRELLDQEYRDLFKNTEMTVAWLQERRHVIEELCDAYIGLARSIRAATCNAPNGAGAPHATRGVHALDHASAEVAAAKKSLLERWLVGSPAEMSDAMARITRGDNLSVDEAFADIAGVDVTTWRQRIADYKSQASLSAAG